MAQSLRVDPAVLRSTGSVLAQVSSDLSGMGLGPSLSELVGDMRGFHSGAVCQEAATAIDNACNQVSSDFSQLAEKLRAAAEQYEHADEQLRGGLDKAAHEIDGNDSATPPMPTSVPGPPASQPAPIPVDQVDYDQTSNAAGPEATRDYIDQALDKLGITDLAARQRWMDGYTTMTLRESSYDPNAVNDWDVNSQPPNSTHHASDGYGNGCSRGLAQCVPGTFAQYHQPGTSNNIYDPVANIAASMNYVMERYGVHRDGSNLAAEVPQANVEADPQGY